MLFSGTKDLGKYIWNPYILLGAVAVYVRFQLARLQKESVLLFYDKSSIRGVTYELAPLIFYCL